MLQPIGTIHLKCLEGCRSVCSTMQMTSIEMHRLAVGAARVCSHNTNDGGCCAFDSCIHSYVLTNSNELQIYIRPLPECSFKFLNVHSSFRKDIQGLGHGSNSHIKPTYQTNVALVLEIKDVLFEFIE